MPLLTSILFLLVVSRLLGQLLVRMGQPAIVGEILAGALLGPSVLGIILPNEHLAGIAELSVFLIVLSAGLEMEFSEVLKAFVGRGLVVAILGFTIPLLSGMAVGVAFSMGPMRTVFLGLCMSITALPVAVRILESFEMLDSPIAKYSISTAILNDVAALLCLGIILDRPIEGGELDIIRSVLKTGVKLALFCGFVFAVSRLLVWGGTRTRYIEGFVARTMKMFGQEALFGISVVFVLMFGAASESLGLHFVIGAFFGGLLLSQDVFGTSHFRKLNATLHSITAGFLAPIFFAFLGLHFSVSTLKSPLFVIAVLAVAMISKVLAGVIAGKLTGMDRRTSLGIGIILNGRGIMELVVADIALRRGLIGQDLFSTLVLMGVITTILTPPLFRKYALPWLSAETPAV